MDNFQLDIFALGYNKNLNKADEFYNSGLPININDSVSPILLGSGDLSGNLSMANGYMQSSDYVTGTSGWNINSDGVVEFNSGTFRGTLEAGSLNIPDQTTANSFHTNTSGDSWWGCNVADFNTDNNNANAYILKDGTANFQNVTVNGSSLDNKPIYGDGSDGSVTISTNTTLSRDMYYTNLTISGGDLNCGGWRVFVSGTLTVYATYKIHRDGSAGDNGDVGPDGQLSSPGTYPKGGIKGTAQTTTFLSGGLGGAGRPDDSGSAGQPGDGNYGVSGNSYGLDGTVGANGSAISASLCSSGVLGGTGGNGGYPLGYPAQGQGASGGTGGTATSSNTVPRIIQTAILMNEFYTAGSLTKYETGAQSGQGGGAGSGDCNDTTAKSYSGGGGGGGASGNNGGIVLIVAKTIVNNGTISAIGGNGGNGGNGGTGYTDITYHPAGGGGGGGGGGGIGGVLILIYNSLTNNGTISVAGGTGGTGGTGGICGNPANIESHRGTVGTNGTDGTGGTLIQLQN